MPAPIVFFDIAGPDAQAQRRFYQNVLDWDVNEAGMFVAPANGRLQGSLRKDPADKVIYFGVPDVTAALRKVEQYGGAIGTPRFEVPGVVVLGLFADPAGNRLGFVEMDGDAPKIP